jgi:hypothetical protein
MSREPRTILEALLQQSDYTLEEWCVRFETLACDLGEDTTLSARHLQRWAAGVIRNAQPVRRRVASRLWGHSFKTLVSPFNRTTVSLGATGLGGSGLPD